MARRKNYTTEQLKEYVDGYVRQKNDYSVITATALADYCNDTLHLLPAVTYQTFTRDKGVMQYIEKINTELHERMLIPSTKGASAHIDSFYIYETASAEEVRQKAYEELEKKEDMIRELQTEYQRQSRLLSRTTEERDSLLAAGKDLAEKMVLLKKELADSKKDLRRTHHILAVFKTCFKAYLYDPIVLRHMTALGWISDGEDAIKRCDVTANIIEEIERINGACSSTETADYEPDDDLDDLPFPGAEQEKEIQDIINTDSAGFLEKLRSL